MDEADNFKFNKYRGPDAYRPRVVFKPIVFVHKDNEDRFTSKVIERMLKRGDIPCGTTSLCCFFV